MASWFILEIFMADITSHSSSPTATRDGSSMMMIVFYQLQTKKFWRRTMAGNPSALSLESNSATRFEQ